MAENEREITTVFRADISNFSANTQQLKRYVEQVNSQFNAATASMGRWNNNTQGLQAKLTQLNGTLEAEEKKLENLQKDYDKIVAQYGANSREAQEFTTKLNNQIATVDQTRSSIKHYEKSLKELQDAGVDTKEELDELNKKIDDQKEAAKTLGSGILKGASIGIAGIGAACVGALGAVSNLVEETKELRTQMGQLENSFNEAGLSTKGAEKTFNELYGVLGDSGQATEAALHLAQVAKSEEELAEYTNILTGVYSKFGASLPIEGLTEAISVSSTLGTISGTLVDAFEFSGKSIDEHNKHLETLTTAEERNAYIKEELNKIYKETGENYKEVNKDVIAANEAQNQYNQAMADIATKAQPAMTSFKMAMVGVLQTVLEKFNEVDITGLIGKISGAITTVVNVALPPLMTALTWVLDNLNWLAPVLGSVIGLIGGISAGIKIYNGVVAIARTVQMAWNLAMTANPIGIVVIAIAGLVAAFVTLWNKCEGFRNFFIKMWEGIKKIGSDVASFIGGIFESKINTVKGIINGVINLINGAIKGINKLKVDIPDWVPEYGGKTIGFNIPTIPKLAAGGIVDKPTLAIIGEAGREAVMPLENNTQWLDKLADKLSGKIGGGNVTNNYTINNKFEKMETSRHAMHKANLELKRIMGG